MRRNKKATVSKSSPKTSSRGCLCPDGKTYSTKCCDGTLQAQGIGFIGGVFNLLQENKSLILQEDNSKIQL